MNQENQGTLPAPFQLLDFRLASFCDMDLRGRDFICCDLRLADFRRANLEDATFVACDLRGTHFGEANMTNVEMPGSVFNSKPTPKNNQEEEDAKVRQLLGWDSADLKIGRIEGKAMR